MHYDFILLFMECEGPPKLEKVQIVTPTKSTPPATQQRQPLAGIQLDSSSSSIH